MHDIDRIASVAKASGEPIDEADRLVRFAEQQGSGI